MDPRIRARYTVLIAALATFACLATLATPATGQPPATGLPSLSILDLSTASATPLVLYERLNWDDLKFDLVLGSCLDSECAPRSVLISEGSANFDDVERAKASLEVTPTATRVAFLDAEVVSVATCATSACDAVDLLTAPSPPGVRVSGLATATTGVDQFRLFIATSGGLFASECSTSSCTPAHPVGDTRGVWGLDVATSGGISHVVTVADDGSDVNLTRCVLADPLDTCETSRRTIGSPNPLPLEATSDIELLETGLPVVLTRTGRGESLVIRCLTVNCSATRVIDVPEEVFLAALVPPQTTSTDVLAVGAMPGGGVQTVRCDETSCHRASFPVLDYGPRARLDANRTIDGDVLIAFEAEGQPDPVLERCDSTCNAGSLSSPLSVDYQGLGGMEGVVARLYAAYFQRDPDQGGFAFWLDAIERGAWTNSRASDHFAASSEFREVYGPALSDSEFLTIAYTNVFGRDPDASGRLYWLDRMDNGLSRGQVVLYFSDSPEFRERSRTR